MCGILGELSLNNNLASIEEFKKILNLSKNRGPNETRIETLGKKNRFGFNRLSILDLSEKASQPIWSPSRRYIIVFNGEIYNHQKLRLKLGGFAKNIQSNSDSVSLAYSIEKWGIKTTINKLEGMFAIGVWDRKKKCLTLARDFAGIKPLFYGWNGKSLVFSSQYNQISNHPHFKNEKINRSVLKLYLNQHFIPPPFGILNNTFSVCPGEIITLNIEGKLIKTKYWNFPEFDNSTIDYNEAENIIENELRNSVFEQLFADVPLGAFLSGGVDSPIICDYANSKIDNIFHTFSLGSDSEIHDETYLSNKFSLELESYHHSIKMTAENSVNSIDKILTDIGEPFGDFSLLPAWELSKNAAETVTVVLSGDGADELFFGYERFRSIAKNHWLWKYPYVIRYLTRGFDRLLFNEKFINECVLSAYPGLAHLGLHSHQPKDFFNFLIPSMEEVSFPLAYDLYKYCNPKTKNELLHTIREAEFNGMLQRTLAKMDRASMANSLEIRVPFLKKSLIEKIIKTGIDVHSPMLKRKKMLYRLLKKSYANIKPEKDKKGFTVPLREWIRTYYKENFYEKLLDKNFCQSFGINTKIMENILEKHCNNSADYKWPLFSLYSLSIWNNARE